MTFFYNIPCAKRFRIVRTVAAKKAQGSKYWAFTNTMKSLDMETVRLCLSSYIVQYQ